MKTPAPSRPHRLFTLAILAAGLGAGHPAAGQSEAQRWRALEQMYKQNGNGAGSGYAAGVANVLEIQQMMRGFNSDYARLHGNPGGSPSPSGSNYGYGAPNTASSPSPTQDPRGPLVPQRPPMFGPDQLPDNFFPPGYVNQDITGYTPPAGGSTPGSYYPGRPRSPQPSTTPPPQEPVGNLFDPPASRPQTPPSQTGGTAPSQASGYQTSAATTGTVTTTGPRTPNDSAWQLVPDSAKPMVQEIADEGKACPPNLTRDPVTGAWRNPNAQLWNDPRPIGQGLFSGELFHPGATTEIRSNPTSSGYGNQCTYDASGNVMQGYSMAPGSADGTHVSNLAGHTVVDVAPSLYDFGLSGEGGLANYYNHRPQIMAQPGGGATVNVFSTAPGSSTYVQVPVPSGSGRVMVAPRVR